MTFKLSVLLTLLYRPPQCFPELLKKLLKNYFIFSKLVFELKPEHFFFPWDQPSSADQIHLPSSGAQEFRSVPLSFSSDHPMLCGTLSRTPVMKGKITQIKTKLSLKGRVTSYTESRLMFPLCHDIGTVLKFRNCVHTSQNCDYSAQLLSNCTTVLVHLCSMQCSIKCSNTITEKI